MIRYYISHLITFARSFSVRNSSVIQINQPRRILGTLAAATALATTASVSSTESEFFDKLTIEGKKITIESGDSYEGKGVVQYGDGSTFRGEWREGLVLKGILTSPTGQESELWFARNNYLYGSIKYSNGNWYSGQINPRTGLPDGQGNLYARSLTRPIYEGKFRNGKFHGKGKKWMRSVEDGVLVYEGEFENGELHGEVVVRRSGQVVRTEEWQRGKCAGIVRTC